MKPGTGYLSAVAHPVTAFLVAVPLLVGYEAGVVYCAAGGPPVRAGADVWVRDALARYGAPHPLAAPALVAGVLAAAAVWRRADRPDGLAKPVFGSVCESVAFAVLLWAAAKNAGPWLDRLAAPPAMSVTFRSAAAKELVTYVGAGVYEEAVFRLGLFAGLGLVLRSARVPGLFALVLAAAASAAAFAYAHHAGPAGEPLDGGRFVFRLAAGVYFTALFVTRGFGVTAGTHAAYDVLVGVAVG